MINIIFIIIIINIIIIIIIIIIVIIIIIIIIIIVNICWLLQIKQNESLLKTFSTFLNRIITTQLLTVEVAGRTPGGTTSYRQVTGYFLTNPKGETDSGESTFKLM